jgi:Domain of unknown function (DUF4352)
MENGATTMYSLRSWLLQAAAVAALLLGGCGAPKFPVITYPMGEKVMIGHLSYTVFETEWLTQLGDESAPRIPQNRFFLVRTSIVNSGGSDVVSPNLTVEDDHGHVYRELSDGDGVPQWIGYLRQIKPADSAQGNLVFDAPPGHYKLRVLDEDGNRAALIDIPLSFNAETPQVPIPGELKK